MSTLAPNGRHDHVNIVLMLWLTSEQVFKRYDRRHSPAVSRPEFQGSLIPEDDPRRLVMQFEQQSPVPAVVSGPIVPQFGSGTPRARSQTQAQTQARELRSLWPDAVDLAKQPGLLYRLQALLST